MHSIIVLTTLAVSATAIPLSIGASGDAGSKRDLLGLGIFGSGSGGGSASIGGSVSGGGNIGTEVAGGGSTDVLGGILGGGDGDAGLVGNILNGVLGGGTSKPSYIDPLDQKLAPGNCVRARKQDGFVLKDIWVYSPPVNLVQGILQAVLGGKKSVFLLRRGASNAVLTGSVISDTKAPYLVTPQSFGGRCCREDIATSGRCTQVACKITVTGLRNGRTVGKLVSDSSGLISGPTFRADECKIEFQPISGRTLTFGSVVVNLGVYF